jgi:two-component system phosphate regulon response regulator PhoB
MQKPYILVVEDEESLALLIRYNLEKEGFEVKCIDNGADALESVYERSPDLIILDWMLPEISGIEVCNEIRFSESTKDIPIIMLTARSQESDKLRGFSSGADDYMSKPFSPKELIARIKSVIRRSKPSLFEEETSYAGIKVDNNKKLITVNGVKLNLSSLEFSLLKFFVTKPEKIHTRESLLKHVWNDTEYSESRTVDVCIRRVRAELAKVAPEFEDLIKTVRGEGYLLEK